MLFLKKNNRKIHSNRFFIINVCLPILSGALIYSFFRNASLYVFEWYSSLGLISLVKSIRFYTNSTVYLFPNWFLYSLPDFMWVYAGTSYFLSIWSNAKNLSSLFWINICLILAVGAEILQSYNLIEGTFDQIDIIMYFFAYLLSIINVKCLN
jgi:hypothetical protein